MDVAPGSLALPLRDYQQEALDAIIEQLVGTGTNRGMVVLPTGAGKTVLFSHLCSKLGGRSLIIAHRTELITQAANKLRQVDPGLWVGIVKAEQRDFHHQVIVASIQSLTRGGRIEKILAHGRIDQVIVDECHHAGAPGYVRALKGLGCFDPGGPLTVGVTATPDEKDRKLAAVFEQVVYHKDILWMIEHGYLCDVRAQRVRLEVDLNQVKTKQGDFQAGELSEALDKAHGPSVAVASWEKFAAGRKTIVFTPTVKLAHQVAQVFQASGHAAEAVDGETHKDVRSDMLDRFRTGETLVLANCGVLTEGYDEPSVSCILMLRPTKSKGLFIQMLGRGLRTYPGKDDCMLIDCTGASKRHSLFSIGDVFELAEPGKLSTESVLQQTRRRAERQAAEEVKRVHIDLAAEAVDILAKFHWIRVFNGYVLALGSERYVAMLVDRNGFWHVGLLSPTGVERLSPPLSMEYAQGFGEDYARSQGADRLSRKEAGWRERPANPGMSSKARRLGIKVPAGTPAGAVSDLIDRKVAEDLIRRKPRAGA